MSFDVWNERFLEPLGEDGSCHPRISTSRIGKGHGFQVHMVEAARLRVLPNAQRFQFVRAGFVDAEQHGCPIFCQFISFGLASVIFHGQRTIG